MSTMNTAVSTHEVWFKSSRSNGNQACVEVRFDNGAVLIRDSKYNDDPASQPIIRVAIDRWDAFLDTITASPADCTNDGLPCIEPAADGSVTLRAVDGTTLSYLRHEWEAFVSGVLKGEFSLMRV
ncbi:DUF397 domain-containing protein [Nocardia tengchongensis]